MVKGKKTFILTFCILLCAAMVFSLAFAPLHQHHCSQIDCSLCVLIKVFQTLIRLLLWPGLLGYLLNLTSQKPFAFLKTKGALPLLPTLITLKVQLTS